MPDTALDGSAGPYDSAAAWFDRSFARILGVPAARLSWTGAGADVIGQIDDRRLPDLIGARYRRVVDEATGGVSIQATGRTLDLAPVGEDADPLLAAALSASLQSGLDALDTIDTRQCLPGTCGDAVLNAVEQTRAVLLMLKAEQPRRRAAFLPFAYLHELLNEHYGHLPHLEALFAPDPGRDFQDLDIERSRKAVRLVRAAVVGCEALITEHVAPTGERTTGDVAQLVGRCGPHLIALVDLTFEAFDAAGLSACELEAIDIELDGPIVLSGATFEQIGLADLLRAVSAEARRWIRLVQTGRPEQMLAISESATVLQRALSSVSGEGVADRFSLPADVLQRLNTALDRTVSYATSLLAAMEDEPHADVGRASTIPTAKPAAKRKAVQPKSSAVDPTTAGDDADDIP